MNIERTPSHATDKKAAEQAEFQAVELPKGVTQAEADIYDEALAKYGVDGDIDPVAEKRVRRKLDMRIIPILGVCYFF
ncbi:hypothetical protein CspHIS471_0202740 [Cutaneotrichosporon sp. HIS471]|nr:hypothetical protein CspHIS471_0202740 [Cutaneotrichosporon sp. HIS471]